MRYSAHAMLGSAMLARAMLAYSRFALLCFSFLKDRACAFPLRGFLLCFPLLFPFFFRLLPFFFIFVWHFASVGVERLFQRRNRDMAGREEGGERDETSGVVFFLLYFLFRLVTLLFPPSLCGGRGGNGHHHPHPSRDLGSL